MFSFHDHIGHRASCPDGLFGYFASKDGIDVLIEDLRRAHRLLIQEKYPRLPVFLLGHSMDSFVAGLYMLQHGDLAVCILSGTTADHSAVSLGEVQPLNGAVEKIDQANAMCICLILLNRSKNRLLFHLLYPIQSASKARPLEWSGPRQRAFQ